MKAYRIDFAMNRGHEMLLDRDGGFTRPDMDEIELQMLRSHNIPHLLPVDWYEVDGKMTFRYSLDGVKMLVHRLQQEPLTMRQYYSLLLGVADAMSSCKDYMLRPEGLLLDEQFIFAGERLEDVRLPYVPVRRREGDAGKDRGELLALAVRWTAYVEEIDGTGLKRVLQLLNGGSLPLGELRAALLDLIEGGQSEGGIAADESLTGYSAHSGVVEGDGDKFDSSPQVPTVFPDSKLLPLRWRGQREPGGALNVGMELEENLLTDEEEERQAGGSRSKWLLSAAAMVAVACVWRFVYLETPSTRSLLVSAGLSLLLVALLAFVWRKGSGLLLHSADMQTGGESFLPDTSLMQKYDRNKYDEREYDRLKHDESERNRDVSVQRKDVPGASTLMVDQNGTTDSLGNQSIPLRNQSRAPGIERMAESEQEKSMRRTAERDQAMGKGRKVREEQEIERKREVGPGRDKGKEGPAGSGLFSSNRSSFGKAAPAPTTLLEPDPPEQASSGQMIGDADLKKRVLCLVRIWDGKEETINLHEANFRIGRAGEQVSYIDPADGVSRIHLEIEASGGVPHAKDLGSRNGSLLNGELMIPYKAYKLSEGDSITLAGEKGPAYILSAASANCGQSSVLRHG